MHFKGIKLIKRTRISWFNWNRNCQHDYKENVRFWCAKNSFDPIVASGPNGNPHHAPSERKIEAGDMLTVDIGALYHGYCSDLTRSFIVGNKPNPTMEKIFLKG